MNLKCSQCEELPLLLTNISIRPCYSKCDPPTNSICLTREMVSNAESQVLSQTHWIRTWHFNKVSRWFMWTFKLEKQCPKVPNPFPAQGLQKYCLILNLSGISPQMGKDRHHIHGTLGYPQLLAQCLLFSVEQHLVSHFISVWSYPKFPKHFWPINHVFLQKQVAFKYVTLGYYKLSLIPSTSIFRLN